MGFNIFSRQESIVGLDISDHVLRLALLKQGRRLKLVTIASVPVPEGVIVHGEIIKVDAAIDLLKKLKSQAGRVFGGTHYAVACLPEPTSFLKLLTVNPTSGGDLTHDVYTEASNHLPMSIDEAYIDWQIVTDYQESLSQTIEVLVAASPRSTVDRYTEILIKAGLEPKVLEIEPIAIGRAALSDHQQLQDKTVAVLDFGATRSGFTVYNAQIPQFSVSLPTAGYEWTKIIASALNLDINQAEEAKQRCGLNNPECEEAIDDILHDSLEEFIRQLQEAIGYFEGHFPKHEALQNLIVTGGGAQMPGLIEFLQSRLGLQIEMAKPLANIDTAKVKVTDAESQQYATALGLARRALIKQNV